MKIIEVTNQLRVYRATVRVHASGSAIVVRTDVRADSAAQAKALLVHMFGVGNVLNVT